MHAFDGFIDNKVWFAKEMKKELLEVIEKADQNNCFGGFPFEKEIYQ
ncbi:hypothetical protein V1503_24285 [Bacillus sp. SCS-151]